MARHVHADLMIATANDSSLKIEVEIHVQGTTTWVPCFEPCWRSELKYRIKPKPPVVTEFYGVAAHRNIDGMAVVHSLGDCNLLKDNNIKLTFTNGKLTKAEVM